MDGAKGECVNAGCGEGRAVWEGGEERMRCPPPLAPHRSTPVRVQTDDMEPRCPVGEWPARRRTVRGVN